MSLEEILCKWVLGKLAFYDMQIQMQMLLEEGQYSDLMSKLAYEVSEDDDVDSVLRKLSVEQGVSFPTVESALIVLAISYANDIANGNLRPYTGAKKILENVIYQSNSNLEQDIKCFESFVSEYDDFSSSGQKEFYGQNKCNEELKRIDGLIYEASKNIVNTSRKIKGSSIT